MSAGLPPLSEEEKAERRARLEKRQASFVQSILTSRSLPKRQSTIAGGSGLTNDLFRVAEEIEASRQAALQSNATSAQEAAAAAAELERRKAEIAEKGEKKKSKRLKKKQRLEERKKSGTADDIAGGSDDDDDEPGD